MIKSTFALHPVKQLSLHTRGKIIIMRFNLNPGFRCLKCLPFANTLCVCFSVQMYFNASINSTTKLLKPLLVFAFCMAAGLAGLTQITQHRSHPTDVYVGYVIGAGIGVYLVSLTKCTKNCMKRIEIGSSTQTIYKLGWALYYFCCFQLLHL